MSAEPSFTCPDCGRVSHHPVDIREGWCNVCKKGRWERMKGESARSKQQEIDDPDYAIKRAKARGW